LCRNAGDNQRDLRLSLFKYRSLVKQRNRNQTHSGRLNRRRDHPNRGARFLEKVIKSAVANAEDKGARNVEALTISEARVDGGPMFKRIQPRARGMAYTIRRRMSHIHIAIEAPELP